MAIAEYEYRITGTDCLGFGGPFRTTKEDGESSDAYDLRCWPERASYTDDPGNPIHLPALAVKKAMESYAAYSGEKIRGQGSKTWTQKFQRGVMELGLAYLWRGTERLNLQTLEPKKLFVPADGKPGGTKRVYRRFPYLKAGWSAEGRLAVVEPCITEERLLDFLNNAGIYVGVGFWRPERRGLWGRFIVDRLEMK